MAFRWRADDGQALNSGFEAFGFSTGSGPVLLKKLICLIFVIFRGGGGGPDPGPCPPLDPPMECSSWGISQHL